MSKIENLIQSSKIFLLNKKKATFISSLLYDIKFEDVVGTELESSVPYIRTDADNLVCQVNSNWFETLSHQQRATSLAHQCFHIALMHNKRIGDKDPKIFNHACDVIIDSILKDCNFELLEEREEINNSLFDLKNVSAEELYSLYLDEERNDDGDENDSKDSFSPSLPLSNDIYISSEQENDEDGDPENSSEKDSNKQEQAILKAMFAEESVSNTRDFGAGGAENAKAFELLAREDIDWYTLVSQFLNEKSQSDPEYNNLLRRMLPYELFLPVTEDINSIDKITVAIDVSYSVREEEVQYFLENIEGFRNQLNPEITEIISFNDNIVNVSEFDISEPVSKHVFDIGGGTSLFPVISHVNKSEIPPKFLIVFSDLECKQIPLSEEPDYQVIWVSVNNPEAQVHFGELVHLTHKF